MGLVHSSAVLQRFEAYEEALYKANETTNLTRVPREECWSRHFVDSLLFQDLIPTGSNVLDIGTGPGLPAWPLACARPDLNVTALDSQGKMLAFLRGQPLPNLEIIQARIEDWDRRNLYDVVTGRALAPLPVQLEVSAAPCHLGGLVIPMRSPSDDLRSPDWFVLGLQPAGVFRRQLPGDGAPRVFPVFKKVEPTPKRFPRRWADIRRNPLVFKV